MEHNLGNDQIKFTDLFTQPHVAVIKRTQLSAPVVTFALTKGPIDLMSVQVGYGSFDFNAYITMNSGSGANTVGPIRSTRGSIDQCILGVQYMKLELFGLPISAAEQTIPISLKACEHTLRT